MTLVPPDTEFLEALIIVRGEDSDRQLLPSNERTVILTQETLEILEGCICSSRSKMQLSYNGGCLHKSLWHHFSRTLCLLTQNDSRLL